MVSAWAEGGLVIDRAALDAVDAHAREAYPDEACGVLRGPAGDALRVTDAERYPNLADRYHALDPEAYPRTARNAYYLNTKKLTDAIARGAADGAPVKVIYHSHCDVGAYFSEMDQREAVLDGALRFPVAYLVASVRGGDVVDDHKLFVWRGGAWVEAAFTVV